MGCERISEGHPKIIKSRKLLPPRARGTARGGGVTSALQTGGGTAGACLAGAGAIGEKRPEVPWEAEGQRSWRFCLFLPSSLVPDLPRDQGARRSGTDRPHGNREQGEDRGTGRQRGLNDGGDAKVSKYWLLLTDR